MEHIERAGVHSGDSACSLPPYSIDAEVQADIRRQTVALARELRVVGLMNVQFAVKDRVVYVLEVNPRASRTVPFVSKAIGVPLAKIAARCMVGRSLRDQGFTQEIVPAHVSVKEAVFPFIKFPGVDTVLGPEMKSTGEVMGIDATFGAAFAKAQSASGTMLPDERQRLRLGTAGGLRRGRAGGARLARAGFRLLATIGTGTAGCATAGLEVTILNKVQEGSPNIVELPAARRGGARHQHAVGCGIVPRLLPDPAHRARAPRAVLHDDRRRHGRGGGHRDHRGGPVMVRSLQEHYGRDRRR